MGRRPQYTLIISQHAYSRHAFIVEHEERFVEQAKAFVIDLQTYKREKDYDAPPRYGDLVTPYQANGELYTRQNVNDDGDIYFIHSSELDTLVREIGEYKRQEETERILYADSAYDESRAERIEIVFKRHDEEIVRELVNRHFHIL